MWEDFLKAVEQANWISFFGLLAAVVLIPTVAIAVTIWTIFIAPYATLENVAIAATFIVGMIVGFFL